MKKHVTLLVVLSFAFFKGIAQILPPPGAVINYTQIMLEYQPLTGAELYVVQVVEDTAGPMFAEPLITQFDSSTATIITGLKFGKKYLWRYAGIIKGTQMGWSGPYNFHIAAKQLNYQPSVPEIVVNDTGLTSGGLIVSDWNDYIMDRNGNNVWYLPEVAGKKWAFAPNGDLRITY
ncbi:MAG TPA: hypothetical protein VK174_12110, partial [Chitinophagales bacterium]|nr:hypothetical protein [Chitinophagales bacterium]